MTTAKETTIRRLLATRLDVLESGLSLLEEEHLLPNSFGGKGFIDIWARDSQGMHVIIELKRSDTSARSALHEIFKYVALFRMNHGIPAHKIRCMVVSTEWHELLVPFAEFTDRAELQAEGFQLAVDGGGVPVSAHRVKIPSLPRAVKLFNQHSLFLFGDEAVRDRMFQTADVTMQQLGADGYLVASMDYTGADARVIYRFGVYVVPVALTAEVAMDINCIVKAEKGLTNQESTDRGEFEDTFLARLSEALSAPDEFVTASPETFAAMLDQGWRRTAVIRRGQLASDQAYSDDDIDRLIKGYEGANGIIYSRLTKPANRLDWSESMTSSEYCLRGNEAWAFSCAEIFPWLAREHSDGSVLINIYNPQCLPEMLYAIARHGDFGFVPRLQIVTCSADGSEGVVMTGVLQWDSSTCPSSPESFFHVLSGGAKSYYLQRHMNEAWQLDDRAMQLHGLRYGMVRLIVQDKQIIRSEIQGATMSQWTPVTRDDHVTNLEDFIGQNGAYIQRFAELVDYHVFRM